jgi:hypothetical protein
MESSGLFLERRRIPDLLRTRNNSLRNVMAKSIWLAKQARGMTPQGSPAMKV